MRYLHTLDPDDLREMDEQARRDQADKDYWQSVAELAAEDAAMEKYYERKYNR